MAKFCSNCGTPYEEGTPFCSNCGAKLSGAPAPKAKKTATTVSALRDMANKKMKIMMIIVLVVSLLIGLATVTGTVDITAKTKYDGKLARIEQMDAREAYVKTDNDKINAAVTCAKIFNLVYGITLLGVAALTLFAMLENACGGKGCCIFKKATAIAAGATFLYAILFAIVCRAKLEGVVYVIAAPISAWVNIALFGGIAALNFLPEKKEA